MTLVQIRSKGLNVPAKKFVGIYKFPLKGQCALVRIFILQRVALPLSLPALSLLIYDKPDLVFLSRSPFLAPCAHPSPRQRSSQHSNLVLPSACIPPRRLRQASLVSILLLYPSNNPSIFLLFIPWDKLPLGLLGHHDCFSNVEQRTKE